MSDLFNYPAGPAAGVTDTSAEAAEGIAPVSGRLRSLVLDAVRKAGTTGLTTNEVAEWLSIGRDSIQPRTSELRAQGLIRDSGVRRPDRNGKSAIVWQSTGAAQ